MKEKLTPELLMRAVGEVDETLIPAELTEKRRTRQYSLPVRVASLAASLVLLILGVYGFPKLFYRIGNDQAGGAAWMEQLEEGGAESSEMANAVNEGALENSSMMMAAAPAAGDKAAGAAVALGKTASVMLPEGFWTEEIEQTEKFILYAVCMEAELLSDEKKAEADLSGTAEGGVQVLQILLYPGEARYELLEEEAYAEEEVVSEAREMVEETLTFIH